jgi:hypothetical protein
VGEIAIGQGGVGQRCFEASADYSGFRSAADIPDKPGDNPSRRKR